MDNLWTHVRRDVLGRLELHKPELPYEERVLIAEHAAREVLELTS